MIVTNDELLKADLKRIGLKEIIEHQKDLLSHEQYKLVMDL